MSHEEALDTLKKQMGADKHSEISSLLQQGATEDNKNLYVSAMKSLNEMFLSTMIFLSNYTASGKAAF